MKLTMADWLGIPNRQPKSNFANFFNYFYALVNAAPHVFHATTPRPSHCHQRIRPHLWGAQPHWLPK